MPPTPRPRRQGSLLRAAPALASAAAVRPYHAAAGSAAASAAAAARALARRRRPMTQVHPKPTARRLAGQHGGATATRLRGWRRAPAIRAGRGLTGSAHGGRATIYAHSIHAHTTHVRSRIVKQAVAPAFTRSRQWRCSRSTQKASMAAVAVAVQRWQCSGSGGGAAEAPRKQARQRWRWQCSGLRNAAARGSTFETPDTCWSCITRSSRCVALSGGGHGAVGGVEWLTCWGGGWVTRGRPAQPTPANSSDAGHAASAAVNAAKCPARPPPRLCSPPALLASPPTHTYCCCKGALVPAPLL
eukprot:245823-Chlamydomonas_euryale.AAC.2